MIKKELVGMTFIFLFIFITGCGALLKDGKGDNTKFERGNSGLVMGFLHNFPQERFIVGNEDEDVVVALNIKNIGTYPSVTSKNNLAIEEDIFSLGKIYLSGFDDDILKMGELVGTSGAGADAMQFVEKKSKSLSELFLQPTSPINPEGGFDTAEFVGKIIANKIIIDEYEPTILATACYPYFTKANPTVCIDPHPFDNRQEKVCQIGSTSLSSLGAPIAVTRIEQEAATGKIQFKIHIKNVGGGDVIWDKEIGNLAGRRGLLDRCSPLGGGILNRKDFDRVQLEKVEIGNVDMLKEGLCSPFSDGTDNIVKLFDGEGFVICTLNVADLGSVQSAYTTPLNIEIRYAYRSTISKRIGIKKLTTIDSGTTTTDRRRPSTTVKTEEVEEPAEEGSTDCPAPIISNEIEERCLGVTFSTIIFQWKAVEGYGVEEYGVEWCSGEVGESMESDPDYCDGSFSPNPFKVVTGLEPDTNYNFKVYMYKYDESACGDLPDSRVANCRTLVDPRITLPLCEDVPVIPDDRLSRCGPVSANTIRFEWEGVQGGAKEYVLTYCPKIFGEDFDPDKEGCVREVVPGANRKTVRGLEPNTNYEFDVYVSKSDSCREVGPGSEVGSCYTFTGRADFGEREPTDPAPTCWSCSRSEYNDREDGNCDVDCNENSNLDSACYSSDCGIEEVPSCWNALVQYTYGENIADGQCDPAFGENSNPNSACYSPECGDVLTLPTCWASDFDVSCGVNYASFKAKLIDSSCDGRCGESDQRSNKCYSGVCG